MSDEFSKNLDDLTRVSNDHDVEINSMAVEVVNARLKCAVEVLKSLGLHARNFEEEVTAAIRISEMYERETRNEY